MTKIPTILLTLFLVGYKMFIFRREGATETPSDLKNYATKRQIALDRLRRYLKPLQRSLSGQINTEVTIGQKVEFRENNHFFRKQPLVSPNV